MGKNVLIKINLENSLSMNLIFLIILFLELTIIGILDMGGQKNDFNY